MRPAAAEARGPAAPVLAAAEAEEDAALEVWRPAPVVDEADPEAVEEPDFEALPDDEEAAPVTEVALPVAEAVERVVERVVAATVDEPDAEPEEEPDDEETLATVLVLSMTKYGVKLVSELSPSSTISMA